MIKVRLAPDARKALTHLDGRIKKRIWRSIEYLKQNPFYGEKLKGTLLPYRRIKVPPLRVIYTFDSEVALVVIYAVGYRGDTYSRMK